MIHHSKNHRQGIKTESKMIATCIYRFAEIRLGMEMFYECYKFEVKERIERLLRSRFVTPDIFTYHLKDLQGKSYGGKGLRKERNSSLPPFLCN